MHNPSSQRRIESWGPARLRPFLGSQQRWCVFFRAFHSPGCQTQGGAEAAGPRMERKREWRLHGRQTGSGLVVRLDADWWWASHRLGTKACPPAGLPITVETSIAACGESCRRQAIRTRGGQRRAEAGTGGHRRAPVEATMPLQNATERYKHVRCSSLHLQLAHPGICLSGRQVSAGPRR